MGLTGRGTHVNVPLSNVAIAYRPEGFIADLIAPIVPVRKQADSYYVWTIADAYRLENSFRAPGTEANRITRSLNSGTYFAKNYALKDDIPYEDIENADAKEIFFSRQSRAEFIKDKLMLDMEYRVALLCTSMTNVGSGSAIASSWTDYTNSKPIEDINTGIQCVQDVTGVRPNRIVFGEYAWRNFRENDSVIKRVYGDTGNGDPRIISASQAKSLFELDQVLIGGAYKSSTQEGQNANLSQIWKDNVLIYYAPMTPRIDKPSLLYSFRWDAIKGMNMQAEVFDVPIRKAEQVQLGYYQDEKITGSGLGFLLTGVGSSQSGI